MNNEEGCRSEENQSNQTIKILDNFLVIPDKINNTYLEGAVLNTNNNVDGRETSNLLIN